MAPTLITHYEVYSAGADQTTLTTPSFTPTNGEVLVVKLTTWNSGDGMAAPTGGGQTYTAAKVVAPGGFNGFAAVYTATVSGSPGSMTVSSAPATAVNTRHSMVVERWDSAQLAGTPAVNGTGSGTGAPSANITTTADNSVVSWCSVDVNSADPTTHTYRLSATEDGLFDGHVGSNSVQYFAYASVASASTVAMGMTAPSSQAWVLAGVEIQAVTGGSSVAPDGIAVPVALGQPTLGQSLTVTPSGVAVPVAVGTPALGGLGIFPTGLAVPLALGTPSVLGEGQTLLHPTSELVAVAWLEQILTTPVGIDLPESSADWGSVGFTQVRGVGGTPHIHIPQRQPVISVDCWASAGNGSHRPPWNRCAQLAEQIRAATEASDASRQVVIGGSYHNAHVQTIYVLTEPRPIPSDVAGYAHSNLTLYLAWVEATT